MFQIQNYKFLWQYRIEDIFQRNVSSYLKNPLWRRFTSRNTLFSF